jgi:hypothetical protein
MSVEETRRRSIEAHYESCKRDGLIDDFEIDWENETVSVKYPNPLFQAGKVSVGWRELWQNRSEES